MECENYRPQVSCVLPLLSGGGEASLEKMSTKFRGNFHNISHLRIN